MDFEKSKENIQPLRGGRNVLQLTTALQALSDGEAQKQLRLQRAEHEVNIQNYVGSDPLDLWFTYIQWLEQSYPKHGHEGGIDKVLKTCLAEFENDPRYIQDRRFLRLWIKYIDYQNNQLELYQLLYNKGVGTSCSELYRAWGCYCEEATDYKKADEVYNLGLQARAQPIDELQEAHKNFQMWFAQRTFHNDSPTKRKAASALAETRQALTSLHAVKRRNIAVVPSQRTGDSIRSMTPGVVRQQNNPGGNQHRSNIVVDVHRDKPGPSSMGLSYQLPGASEGSVAPVQSILQSCSSEENHKEVGIWTNPSSKSGKLGTTSKLPVGTTNSIIPYEDEGIILSANHVPYCKEDFSDFVCPMTIPDPPDPTKITQYNKKEVYKEDENGIITEYSIEEIRARRYITAYKSSAKYKSLQSAITEPYHNSHSLSLPQSNTSALQTLANCALTAAENDNKYHQYASPLIESNSVQIKPEIDYPLCDVPVSSEFNLENIIAQSHSILNAEDNTSVVLEQNDGFIVEYIDMRKPQQLYDNAAKMDNMLINEAPVDYNSPAGDANNFAPPKKSIYADFNRSLMANVQDDSMTVNTRAANRMVDNVFASPVLSNSESISAGMVPPLEIPHFEIHADRSMTMAAVLGKAKSSAEDRMIQNESNLDQRGYGAYLPRTSGIPTSQQKNFNMDETCSTQTFFFEVPNSSTPQGNQANQFKKPYFLDYNKTSSVRKFNIVEIPENPPVKCEQNGMAGKLKEPEAGAALPDENPVDNNGLSTIMESTREHRSGSSSSGSYQTRNTMFAYTGRESCGATLGVINEKSHQDSQSIHDASNHQATDPGSYSSRQPVAKMATNHINRNYAMPNDNKSLSVVQPSPHNPHMSQQFHTIDHQYHKPSNSYNGYSTPRSVPGGYQNMSQQISTNSNGMYQHHANYQAHGPHATYPTGGYQNPQMPYHSGYHQQGIQTGFQSPQHAMASPQHAMASPQPGFSSPQQGFTSPQPGFTSPQQGYASPQQGYASPLPGYPNQHIYQQVYMSPHNPQAGFQSPPHVVQGYPSPHQAGFQSPPHAYQAAPLPTPPHSYQTGHAQSPHHSYQLQHQQNQQMQHQLAYNNQANNSVARSPYANQQHADYGNANHAQNYPANQSYAMHSNSYQTPKPQPMNTSYNNYQNTQSPAYVNYKNTQNSTANVSQQQYPTNNMNQMHQEYPDNQQAAMNHSQYHQNQPLNTQQSPFTNQNQMYNNASSAQKPIHPANSSLQMHANVQQTHKPPYQSPTSKLRSVRHEVPHATPKPPPPITSPAANPGFSNQFLDFISARNEPKDNANTPKFNNSPTISQKMHKNLYVSSPEQGQVPPTTDLNASEISKENSSVRTTAPSKTSFYNQSITDKHKDLSKRQLDFDHRTELQSEDSRDSGKNSRISSRQSMKSMSTDNHQMDVDSENSMDCQNMTFKSNCSNVTLTTQDIPRPATVAFPKVIDPFNSELNNSLLQYVKFPNKNHIEGYVEMRHIPKLQPSSSIILGYSVEKQLGKGTFGFVYRGVDIGKNKAVALKYQKPGNPWEYYICKEIQSRVTNPNMLLGYMDINKAFLGDNASIFVSELSKYGSLLDVTNKVKAVTNKCINELVVMLMASEMLSIVHYLHKAEIIHADIKPDNFLLMTIPQMHSRHPSLQLIDLGCAIDMSLYPEGTTFTKVISTEGFTCTEMRENRPWTYQTDLYCLAGTIFLLLMGKYMQPVDCGGQWNVEKKWPRYMKAVIWDKLFITLLNIKDSKNLPDLVSLKEILDEHLRSEGSHMLTTPLSKIANVLNSR